MKENLRKCAKCGRSPAGDSTIRLYRFPKPGKRNLLRCGLWAKYCYPNTEWASHQFQEELYKKHLMLCNHHFKPFCFISGGNRLIKSATPDESCDEMLNITEPGSSTKQPLLENMNILNTGIHAVVTTTEHEAGPSTKADIMAETTIRKNYEMLRQEAGPSKEAGLGQNNMIETPTLQKDQEVSTLHIAKKKEQYLYRKCQKYIKKISCLQKSAKKLKSENYMNALINDTSVNKFLETKMSSTFALLLQGQLKNFKKKARGRRWSTAAKIIALRLYKRSPTSYRLLRRLICLPNPTTLKQLLSNFELRPGPNSQIFSIIKKMTKNQEPMNNEFVLMFDEMSIKKNLSYNKKEDIIEGYQDHAEQGRTSQVASHALVFMIAGIRKKVKQPIAYFLSGASVTADRLAVLIKTVLNSCFQAGLSITATVCDMDGVNKRAITMLGATVQKPIINISGHEIVALFDTPHLLKCFRNNFLKYDIKCATNIFSSEKRGIGMAKWSHIQQFFELDNMNPNFVFAPSLRKDHLNPNTKQKMKVKLAAQVMSHTVAAGIFAKIAQGELPAEAATTADVLSNMDKLFDSVNAASPDLRRGKLLSTNLTKGSPHLDLFKKMTYFFQTLEFVGSKRPPPSLEGWIWTLKGLEKMWNNLRHKHPTINSLATRRLQQDPLENLFGCIRGHCGSNVNPTAGQFVAGLKTANISNLSHVSTGNCEQDDNGVVLDSFQTLLTPVTDIHTKPTVEPELSNPTIMDCHVEEEDLLSGELQACAYVCGFIIKNVDCPECRKDLLEEVGEHHRFIEFKEYEDGKQALKYSSKKFTVCVEECASMINNFLKTRGHENNLKQKILTMLKTLINFDYLINCKTHKKSHINQIILSVFHICIKRYCIVENRRFSDEAAASALRKKIDILKHK